MKDYKYRNLPDNSSITMQYVLCEASMRLTYKNSYYGFHFLLDFLSFASSL